MKKCIRVLAAALSILLLPLTAPAAAAAVNLLQNHSFENDSAWVIWPNYGVIEYCSAKSSRGARSIRMQDSNATSSGGVAQAFAAQPGQTYTLSADLCIPAALAGPGGAALGFTYIDTNGIWNHETAQPVKSTDGWERYSFTFTYPEDAAHTFYAAITQNFAAGEIYVDNVRLEKCRETQCSFFSRLCEIIAGWWQRLCNWLSPGA